MEELVKYIIERLVDNPEGITYAVEEDVIVVTVPQREMGRVIGKQGKIAKAIRTVVKAASKDKKIGIDIREA